MAINYFVESGLNGFVESGLKGLAEGDETSWDYLASMVEPGWVKRGDVIDSLEKCLTKVIPGYSDKIVTEQGKLNEGYWRARLIEAERALISIKEGGVVTYRTIDLGFTRPYIQF